LAELEKGNPVRSTKAEPSVVVLVDIKQEKGHHQKREENHVNARLKHRENGSGKLRNGAVVYMKARAFSLL
jgi:hypothetical protein